MYYIRIYHNIATTQDYNEISDSPPMTLSPSASVHSHRIDVCLSPVEPLPMASHNLFAIFILAETIDMQVRERTVDKIKKW
jgi:hypothetical protein